jgi:hypothetical protein
MAVLGRQFVPRTHSWDGTFPDQYVLVLPVLEAGPHPGRIRLS